MPSLDTKPSGRRRAAALMVIIGKQRAAEVLRCLTDEEVERLTWEISTMGALRPDFRHHVIDDFARAAVAHNVTSPAGFDFAEGLLRLALGEEKATALIDRLSASSPVVPFGFLRRLSVQQLVGFLVNEHPQTIALLLSFLDSERGAQVLSALDPSLAADVAQRVALIERANPDVVAELEALLRRKLGSVLLPSAETQTLGGLDVLVSLLRHSSRTTEKVIVEALEANEPDLAGEVKKRMFVFENIIALDDRTIQRILRDVDIKDLALALKSTSEPLKDCILRNMSARAAAMLRDDMETSGPVRLRQVEEAQQRVVDSIRRLEAADEIVISRGGDDELVG